jgi:glutamate/tyrosine decarboxylase-like PLP-dependent enzyme
MSSDNPCHALLFDAAERATRYLAQIPSRSVTPSNQALDEMKRLGGALPDQGENPSSVLALLDEFGSPATVATMGGRYFGYVIGGALPATVAAHWLADAWDQNVCLYSTSPVGAYLEEVALKWILDLLQLPADSGGALVTGGQMANFTCLAAARHAVLRRAGWDVENDGLFNAPPITVVVGAEVHATALKALALLGLGRNRVVTVATDEQGRMRVDELPRIDGPAIVCVQAGNVNTGAFDPIEEVCLAVHSSGAWVHVDGAFGLWAAAASTRRSLVSGIAAADSWATDAHKWLNVPYDNGIAIVRNPSDLRAAMSISSPYLNPGERREPMQWGPESSRRARAVEVWAALRSLGRQGVQDLVERCCRFAVVAADRLRDAGFEILNDVVLNQVLVSFGESALTQRIVAAIQADGTCWCGPSAWHGKTAIRMSISSWATTEADIDRSLSAIIRIAQDETEKMQASSHGR